MVVREAPVEARTMAEVVTIRTTTAAAMTTGTTRETVGIAAAAVAAAMIPETRGMIPTQGTRGMTAAMTATSDPTRRSTRIIATAVRRTASAHEANTTRR